MRARAPRSMATQWCRWSLLLLLPLLFTLCGAVEPGPDSNGDGIIDDNEARAQQELEDLVADAAALLSAGSPRAKEGAAHHILQLAVQTTITQPFHPVTFRNAAIKAGIVELLVALLVEPPPPGQAAATPAAQRHALAALEAIATDDPSTDLDNDHARYVCDSGAVKQVVRLLSSTDESIQVHAASCAAILAESVACQTALSAAGAEQPLVQLATFGIDVAKLAALAALQQLALNNPTSQERITTAGGLQLLHGIQDFGFSELRGLAGDVVQGLEAGPDKARVAVDVKSHARMAHEARLKHSKIWSRSVGLTRAYSPAENTAEEAMAAEMAQMAGMVGQQGWAIGAPESGGKAPADRRAECAQWASGGECKRNPGYMLENCARSCAGRT